MQKESVSDILFYADKWNIGFTLQTAADFIQRQALDTVKWLKEEDSDYSADPFVVIINDVVYVYYEFLNFWQGKGKICRIQGMDFSSRQAVSGFNPSGIHYSYPYTFEDAGSVYCIPETAEANEVALYEIISGNTALVTRRRTLLSGAPYLDSSLIYFAGKYWLFTCKKNRPREILIYFAATLSDTFEPHAMNPVACNEQSYRSAGHLFLVNGTLYRPTQNLKNQYGGSIIIQKINRLTETVFESERLFEVLPRHPYNDGMHNISFTGGMIIIDGKRKVKSPVMLLKKINMKLKHYWRLILLASFSKLKPANR